MEREFDDKTVQYLQMLQNSISRMSTTSALFKGFSATIVSGAALLASQVVNIGILGLSFLPVLLFWIMDLYYLRLERIMRYWYEQVRLGNRPTDFKLKIDPVTENINPKEARIRIFADCMCSKSIWPFYLFITVVLIGVLLLKMKGVG